MIFIVFSENIRCFFETFALFSLKLCKNTKKTAFRRKIIRIFALIKSLIGILLGKHGIFQVTANEIETKDKKVSICERQKLHISLH